MGAKSMTRLLISRLPWLGPWLAVAFVVVTVGAKLLPERPTHGYDLEAFARLPVLEGGRVKPIDTVGRNALLMIRTQQDFRVDGESISATRWLLDALFRPGVADAQPAFEISDPEVLGLMGLQQGSSRYYPFRAVAPHIDEIQKQAMAAQGMESAQRSRFQRAVLNLFERVWLYHKVQNTLQLPGAPSLGEEIAAARTPQAAERQAMLRDTAQFRPLPPAAGAGPEAWRSVGQGLMEMAAGQSDPVLVGWARVGQAWTAQDAGAFNQAMADLSQLERAAAPAAMRQAARELVFNRAQPFIMGIEFYLLALVAVFLSWFALPGGSSAAEKRSVARPISYVFLGAGMLVHTAGLVARIILQGRPPVTNLYSSAVFVGWVAVLVGIVLEALFRRGFGTLVAGAIGVGTLIIAQNLTGEGDTMEMMRAVLDSNFWLSTHVITITVGYGGTFLAGIIAIVWTARQHLYRSRDPGDDRLLASMAYGVVCFALFFSFLGTVLGGIWADQSWGRFWGWDPKENGALLIVLWNAIILHARWGGYARERGLMAMAIFGNVITSLSWFGVNMLGVGLHSYGFMDKAFWALFAFIASQLVLVGLAILPPRFWTALSPGGRAREDGANRAPAR